MVLRPWRVDDAPALVAAWSDAEIQRWTAVPAVRDLAAAGRWVRGDARRRARWLSLDLVVEREGAVVGEVGLTAFDREAGTAEIGWWTAAARRGEGIASAAVSLVAGWAHTELGLEVVARCDVANGAALAVARKSGVTVRAS